MVRIKLSSKLRMSQWFNTISYTAIKIEVKPSYYMILTRAKLWSSIYWFKFLAGIKENDNCQCLTL